MKHSLLRHEKNCLNCGATIPDRYCSHCGQENTEPIESFGHLLNHFFADVTHYDSQLLATLKYLVFKPGFLTRQYNAGKRLSYLNPIRMYIFISAVFFLLLFSAHEKSEVAPQEGVNTFKQHLADSLRKLEKKGKNLPAADAIRNSTYAALAARMDTPKRSGAGAEESLKASINNEGEVVFHLQETKYSSLAQYDAAQQKLPDSARDNAASRYILRKIIRLNNEHGASGDVTVKQNIAHNVPKLMFILLPLFAVFVRMFYSKTKYVYSQHAIFSLHFHSFVFLAFIVLYALNAIFDFGIHAALIVSAVATLGIYLYLATALHRAYDEKFWRSALKAAAISLCYYITLVIGSVAVIIIAFMLL